MWKYFYKACHGLRNTHEINTSSYEGDKQEGNHTRKQARSDQLEHEDDDEDYTIKGLKNGNVNENENEGKLQVWGQEKGWKVNLKRPWKNLLKCDKTFKWPALVKRHPGKEH